MNLSDDNDYYLGVNVFDRLTYGQRISALSIIGNGLLRQDVRTTELTAVVEGAIAAVFEHLRNCIRVELDEPEHHTQWREKVVSARNETDDEKIPSPDCDDFEEWGSEIEILSEHILWDADYDDDFLFVDDSPEKSKILKRLAARTLI